MHPVSSPIWLTVLLTQHVACRPLYLCRHRQVDRQTLMDGLRQKLGQPISLVRDELGLPPVVSHLEHERLDEAFEVLACVVGASFSTLLD